MKTVIKNELKERAGVKSPYTQISGEGMLSGTVCESLNASRKESASVGRHYGLMKRE